MNQKCHNFTNLLKRLTTQIAWITTKLLTNPTSTTPITTNQLQSRRPVRPSASSKLLFDSSRNAPFFVMFSVIIERPGWVAAGTHFSPYTPQLAIWTDSRETVAHCLTCYCWLSLSKILSPCASQSYEHFSHEILMRFRKMLGNLFKSDVKDRGSHS